MFGDINKGACSLLPRIRLPPLSSLHLRVRARKGNLTGKGCAIHGPPGQRHDDRLPQAQQSQLKSLKPRLAQSSVTRRHGFLHEAVHHLPPPRLRAGGVRGDRGRRGAGVRRGVLPGRPHHLRQLPRAGAGRVRLRVRAGRRQGLRAPPRRRRHQLQLQLNRSHASQRPRSLRLGFQLNKPLL